MIVRLDNKFIMSVLNSLLITDKEKELIYSYLFIHSGGEGIQKTVYDLLYRDTKGYTYEVGPMALSGYNDYVRLVFRIYSNEGNWNVVRDGGLYGIFRDSWFNYGSSFSTVKRIKVEELAKLLETLVLTLEREIYINLDLTDGLNVFNVTKHMSDKNSILLSINKEMENDDSER